MQSVVFLKKTKLFHLSLTLSLGVLLSPAARAQTPVDAGALQQQIERERQTELSPHGAGLPEGGAALKEAPKSDEARITVKEFRFSGNTLLTTEELSAAVAPYLHHPISFAELQNAAAAVGEAYRVRGRIVRSFLPEQDIKDGAVTIGIVEGRFGRTKTEGDQNARIAPGKIESMVAAQQQGGEPLDTNRLDRALLLIDDLPGVAASGRLQQGAKEGETDLVVKESPEARMSGIAAIDNEGSRDIGRVRGYGYAQFMGPFGIGDQSSVYALGSEGLQFGRIEETVPLGDDGLRVGVNGSLMQYKILPPEFDALDGKGNSASAGLQASYPFIRAREYNLYGDLNYDYRYFNNDAQDNTSSHYHTKDYTAALRGNFFDGLGGGGGTTARIAATMGDLDLGTLDPGENPKLEGSFSKYTLNMTRLQTVMRDVTLYAAVSGQYSPDRLLDTSERFYLGGPDGVRAYPVSEGSGSSGILFTVEPRWRFAENFQLSAFYDHGYVHNRDGAKNYSLKGAGFSLAWQAPYGANFKGTWAHRIGENPNPTITGDDQDGSLTKNRFWLTLSMQF
jgi:hemolysin activation/secretion protein